MEGDDVDSNQVAPRRRPWWAWLAVVVAVVTGIAIAAVSIPEAYKDAVDRNLCRKQLSQIDEAFRLVTLLGGAGFGIVLLIWVALKLFDPTSVGKMVVNPEITAVGILTLTMAVVIVAGIFTSHCGTTHQADVWCSAGLLFVALVAWVCNCPRPF